MSDLDKATTFFEQGLAWKRSSRSTENMILFDLGGFGLALYPKKLLAEDANMPENGNGFLGITLSFNAKNEAEVDQVMAEATKVGGRIVKKAQKVFWGGYSGYFMDLDGHLIEVAYNPYWEMDEKGNLKIPP